MGILFKANKKLDSILTFNQRKAKKYFFALFLGFFLIFNWGYFSWFFNYRVLANISSSYVEKINPENILPILKINPFSGEAIAQTAASATTVTVAPVEAAIDYTYLQKSNFLEIPKLSIKAPITFTTSTKQKDMKKALIRGVLHYPSSVLPGQEGFSVILGHSSPPNWPKIKYDWIFNDLNKLAPGDKFQINFNEQIYEYIVVEKLFIERGQELPSESLLTKYKSVVVLISCWPPGKDRERIIIGGVLKEEVKSLP